MTPTYNLLYVEWALNLGNGTSQVFHRERPCDDVPSYCRTDYYRW